MIRFLYTSSIYLPRPSNRVVHVHNFRMSSINWVSLRGVVSPTSKSWVLSSLLLLILYSNHGTIMWYLWSPWVELFMPITQHEPYKSNNLVLRSTYLFSSWVVHSHNYAWTLQVENQEIIHKHEIMNLEPIIQFNKS